MVVVIHVPLGVDVTVAAVTVAGILVVDISKFRLARFCEVPGIQEVMSNMRMPF